MRIREVDTADLESPLALYRHLHAEDEAPPPERAGEVWTEILGDDRAHIYVGELNGALVVSCTLILVPNLTVIGGRSLRRINGG